jgi:hypothetical protein
MKIWVAAAFAAYAIWCAVIGVFCVLIDYLASGRLILWPGATFAAVAGLVIIPCATVQAYRERNR